MLILISGCSKTPTAPSQHKPDLSISAASPLTAAAAPLAGQLLWKERRALTWDDFQGTPDPASPYLAFSQVGSTDVGTVTVVNGQVTIPGAETVFDPSRSWVEPAGRTDALLHHEQGHFDLEEAITRELRSAIESVGLKARSNQQLNSRIQKLIGRYRARRDRLQDQYDAKTKHGTDPSAQARWDDRILKLLNEPALFRDDFSGPALAAGWTWARENPATWSLANGNLQIELEYGDLWEGWTNNCRNLLLRTPPLSDDYTVETHLSATLVANINQALIILYGDDNNYVRFGLIRCCGGVLNVNHVHEIGAVPQPQIQTSYGSGDVYLRIVKTGGSASLQYSSDGTSWSTHTTIPSLGFSISGVGLVAFDGSEPPSASVARYDYFQASVGTP